MISGKRSGILVMLVLLQTGCALVYDELRSKPIEQCKAMISYADRQECLQRHRTSYEHYEKQREQLRQQEQGAR